MRFKAMTLTFNSVMGQRKRRNACGGLRDEEDREHVVKFEECR